MACFKIPGQNGRAMIRLTLRADRVAIHGANQPATAFEEADQRRSRPDDFRLHRKPANLRMVERNDRAAKFELVIVREADARQRQILADDRRRLIHQQVAIVVERREAKRVRDREAVSAASLVRLGGRASAVDQPLNLRRQRLAALAILQRRKRRFEVRRNSCRCSGQPCYRLFVGPIVQQYGRWPRLRDWAIPF